MKAHEQAKAYGLKQLNQVTDHTEIKGETFRRWHRDKPRLFKVVCLGVVAIIDSEVGKERRYNWVFENSSGYAGFRCTNCATWIYQGKPFLCKCDSKTPAPWTDFKGNDLREGDFIEHPSGERGKIVLLANEEEDGDKWRVDYGVGKYSRLCLQVGDKGRAVKVK